ncbi:MAG: mannosyltransferase family protein [Acidimicrobiales bacterium]
MITRQGRSFTSVGSSARAAVLPFCVSRVIVLAALGLARFIAVDLHPTKYAGLRAVGTVHAGLSSWDAAWYLRIARVGYGGAGRSSLRFFPLFPVLGRGLATLAGISAGVALILVANGFAFLALVLLHSLVSRESLGPEIADRSLWVLSLWPAGFVLVMGYSEALLLFLTLAAYLCWRTGHWWWSVLPAYLAGTCRPVGLLLAVPALVEALSWWRSGARRSSKAVGARATAVIAAPAGTATYLGWCALTGRGFTEPLALQLSSTRRGAIGDPVVALFHDAVDLAHGRHLGTALHAPFLVAFVILTAYLFRRLPSSYGWYAVATMAVAITAPNLDSLERYGLACFPLTIAAACLIESKLLQRAVFAGMGALLSAFALLAFLGLYVP